MKNLLTGFLTLWLCLSAQADDIDIFQGQSSGLPQNVMFLMDTSRSMSRWVYLDLGPYDPNTTYPVPINGFDPETYYYGKFLNGNGSTDIENSFLQDRSLNKEAIVCDGAVDVIEQYGLISGKFKRWDPIEERWEAPGLIATGLPHASQRPDALWECKNDELVHPADYHIRFSGASNSNKYRTPAKDCFFGACWTAPWYSIAYGAFWIDYVRKIFKGNYLNYQIYSQEGSILGPNQDKMSRMTLARAAAKHAANTVQGFNLGLARFDSNSNGGFIDLPIGPIDTNKTLFNEKIDKYFTMGGTPLSESYFEIARYYRGDNVYFGNDTISRVQDDTVDRWSSGLVNLLSAYWPGVSHDEDTPSAPGSRVGSSGNSYLSPIDSACQSESIIVLFTDGEPQSDVGANSAIQSMIQEANFPADSGLSKSCSGNGGCADELAYYLANYDQSDKPGKQTIRTFVVGGFLEDNSGEGDNSDGGSNNDLNGIPLLKSIARHGEGEYFGANSYEEIVEALTTIFSSASDAPATFVAPAISTNSYNSFEHRDELYYAMFSPNNRANWKGNLKLYRLNESGYVVDANDNSAIDSTGQISEDARSFWTDALHPDGRNVAVGGAAENLTKSHKIFTHLTESAGALTTKITDSTEIKTLMQLPASISDNDVTSIINWANRIDPEADNGTRAEMEDPLHSQPVIINYAGTSSTNSVVYMSTNSGYLHAFKADKNHFKEYFSYVPKELLPNIATYANSPPVRKDELYGLDGKISYLFMDTNKDGEVDSSDGDQVILLVGMRRGGRNYYALDVTDPENPVYLWQINGGSSDFSRLGQSWSKMTPAKVPWGNGYKVVLFFGGGYDENEDDTNAASSNQLGNAVYMIDAKSGNVLWKASKSGHNLNLADMDASIPNDIQLVDYNGDNITDFFYVSDVAGRIWRFDINKINTNAGNFAKGGMIFDANGSSGDSVYNRFYNNPSISYFKDGTNTGFMTLSIGTGFRASPLRASEQDAFYIIKDYNITEMPTSYTTIVPSDLAIYSVSSNTTSNTSEDAIKSGWRMDMPGTSEKVLTSALTTHGRVIFTTFVPKAASNPGSCSADVGSTRNYTLYFQGGENKTPTTDLPCVATNSCPQPPACEATNTCPEPPGYCPDGNCAPEIIDTQTIELSCKKEPELCSCEDSGTVVLSGTKKVGKTITRCGILEKDYWLER